MRSRACVHSVRRPSFCIPPNSLLTKQPLPDTMGVRGGLMYRTILDAVGNTPLLQLNRMTGPRDARILVKYEGVNIGGSVKTRTALAMVLEAEKQGVLKPDSIIVEPTSGNQGIGLALVGAVRGYQVRIILPDSVSLERRKLIRQYGAQIVLVPDKGNIGECIGSCIALARKMAMEDSRVFVPQQFENMANVRAHFEGTGREILHQAGCKIDGFCAGIGTGGTITGVGRVLRQANPDTVIWAAEPDRAAILSGGCIGTHQQMGIGDGVIPPILDRELIDSICIVTDEEAMETARALARQEGILAGISSGTNVAAALRLARFLGPGKTVVTVAPDTGERYCSTDLFSGE